MSFETTALLLTWVALALLALVVAGLVRQVHQLTTGPRTDEMGPRPGLAAPGLDDLAPEPGRPTVLLFLGDDCPACHDVFSEALGLTAAPPIRALFHSGAFDADPPGHLRVLTGRRDLFDAYQVPATPFGVIIGTDGRIRTAEPVGSVRGLRALVAEAGDGPPGGAELDDGAINDAHAPAGPSGRGN